MLRTLWLPPEQDKEFHTMAMSGIELIVVAMLMFAGGGDAVSFLDSQAFWKQAGVEATADSMLQVLSPKAEAEPADASAWIAKLGDGDAAVRRDARNKLLELGPAVRPQLEKHAEAEDPEVAQTVRELLTLLNPAVKPSDEIMRLMAIRELGQLKASNAEPLLTKLASSPDAFEAAYAKAALALIRGEPAPEPVDARAKLDKDLMRLPGNSALMLRTAAVGDADWNEILKMMAMMGVPADVDTLRRQATPKLVEMLKKSGNFRLDGLGVSMDVEGRTGAVAIRGLCDARRLGALLAEALGQELQTEEIDGATVYAMQNARLTAIGNELLVLGFAENGAFAMDQALAALTGKNAAAAALSPEMASLVKGTAKAGPLWMALLIGEEMKQNAQQMGMFDSMQMSTQRKADKLEFTIRMKGQDPAMVQNAAALWDAQMQQGKVMLQQQAAMMPGLQMLVEMMNTIELAPNGNELKMTMSADPTVMLLPLAVGGMAMRMAPMMRGGMGAPGAAQRAPNAAAGGEVDALQREAAARARERAAERRARRAARRAAEAQRQGNAPAMAPEDGAAPEDAEGPAN
jgi:hypothetical protein